MQLFNWLRKGLLTLISRLQTQGLKSPLSGYIRVGCQF